MSFLATGANPDLVPRILPASRIKDNEFFLTRSSFDLSKEHNACTKWVSFTKVLQKPLMMETIGSWEDSQRGASFVERRGKGACLWAPMAKPEALRWCNAFIVSQSIIGEICHWARKFEEKNYVGWTNLVFWISRV